MPVTVMPNSAASRSGRNTRPSRSGRAASNAAVTPHTMLLWMVKKLSTRINRPTVELPRRTPAVTSCGEPGTRSATTSCSTSATATRTATSACQQRAVMAAA